MTETEANPENQPQISSGLVDLSDLKLMPAWVGEFGKEEKIKQRYADSEERPQRGGRDDRRGGGFGGRDDRRGPPPRRDGPGGGGPRQGAGGGFRPRGEGGPPRRDGDDRRGPPRRFGDRDRDRGGPPQREWVEIPKDVQVTIFPDDKSVDALAAHVRQTGHAFSMFDAARLVLAGGDRFMVRFRCAEERATGLYHVSADGGLFLTRDEALAHVLRSAALDEYYRVEEIELEAPKGEFASVAVCGLSGEIIAPPSHHSYQTGVIRMHRERFANMSLEDYKRRIRVEANPELVAKWKENMSKGRRWVCLKGEVPEGGEPLALSSRADMEAHFRRTFGNDAVIEVREAVVPGNIDKQKLAHIFFIMLRQAVDAARKHLFEISQKLGAGLERRGLKLFKRRAGKQFVCRVKPRAIESGMVFSDRLAQIVEQLKINHGMPMQKLVESIVPSPEVPEGTPADAPKHPTEEQIAVIKDIRWLANEGYVIEYSDGMVFLGVQGEPVAAKKEGAAEKGAPAAEAALQGAPVEESLAEETLAEEAEVALASPAAEEPAKAEVREEESAPAEAESTLKEPPTEESIEETVLAEEAETELAKSSTEEGAAS
ncbi:hypothetical protein [Prosthecobacter vanneervenii]|uniref:Uncharacterized protein n=1 Tax=Prosthecobacter vanneervenii TaxID=48466 RepID=A0A7W8DLA1_9BACT|nr:hypothetical protein [Prosthecobacter vanneervenii]MBB5034174.1 hypothetical protein [Prosthecobacter vanneervenii]